MRHGDVPEWKKENSGRLNERVGVTEKIKARAHGEIKAREIKARDDAKIKPRRQTKMERQSPDSSKQVHTPLSCRD